MATGHGQGVGQALIHAGSEHQGPSSGTARESLPKRRELRFSKRAPWGRRKSGPCDRLGAHRRPFQNEGRTCQPRELLLESQEKLPYHTGFS